MTEIVVVVVAVLAVEATAAAATVVVVAVLAAAAVVPVVVVEEGNKLRTYARLKNISGKSEPYLNSNLPAKYVTLTSNLRISTHKLEIDRGRYTKPQPKRADERHCMVCRPLDIEDDIHFLKRASIKLYSILRIERS